MNHQFNIFEEMFEEFPKQEEKIVVVEMYSGIGSQRLAFDNLDVEVKKHFTVEVDIDATISYAAIHENLKEKMEIYDFPSRQEMIADIENMDVINELSEIKTTMRNYKKQKLSTSALKDRRSELMFQLNWWKNDQPKNIQQMTIEKLKQLYLATKLNNNLGNVFLLDTLPAADVITWSTPCQDFSISGKTRGFDGKKGGLTFVTLKLFKQLKIENKLPKILLFENVQNIMGFKFKHGFDIMRKELRDLGYENITMILNAEDFTIAQNRKRVFILSIRNDFMKGHRYGEPKPHTVKIPMESILETNVDDKHFLPEKYIRRKIIFEDHTKALIGDLRYSKHEQSNRIWNIKKSSPTLTASMKDYLTTPKIYIDGKIRILTSKECFRLMGFTDQNHDNARHFTSERQIYKQAGNSIVSPIIFEILKSIFKEKKKRK